jgi:hypothetical protein
VTTAQVESTYRRRTLTALGYAALAVLFLLAPILRHPHDRLVAVLFQLPIVPLPVFGAVGAWWPFGNLQRVFALLVPLLYYFVVYATGGVRYLIGGRVAHRGTVWITTGAYAVASVGFVISIVWFWRHRHEFMLPPYLAEQAAEFPRSGYPLYRDIGAVLDDDSRLRVGLYRDRYLRLGRGQVPRVRKQKIVRVLALRSQPPRYERAQTEDDA